MEATMSKNDGVIVCAVEGEVDMYAAPNFHAQYIAIASKEPTCPLVIDLEKTTYLDSSGIGVLFQIYSDSRTRGIGFCLCGAHGMVEKLFALSRMSSILPMEKTRSGALDRVRKTL